MNHALAHAAVTSTAESRTTVAFSRLGNDRTTPIANWENAARQAEHNQIRINMDGGWQLRNNVFVEGLWHSVNYKKV